MSEITVTEALKELKTLDARITKQTSDATFATFVIGGKLPVGQGTEDQFRTKATGSLKSITDLIARRNAIKTAIVASNATTNVTIGGVTYTVAGAIEHKASIGYKQKLVKYMGIQLLKTLREIESQNVQVQRNLDSHITTILGKDAKDKGGDEVETFTKNYLAKNEAKIVDPINAKEQIDALEAEIEGFLANVDTQLSISNATTQIVV